MSNCKQIYRMIVPLFLRKKIGLVRCFFSNREKYNRLHFYRKHNVSFGKENSDKRFFVVRRDSRATGLLACYICALGHMIDVDKDVLSGRLIPVMDMFSEHYGMAHNNEDGEKKVNAWEYYFKQLSDYSMNDVLKSRHVTLSYGYEVENALQFFHDNEFNRETVKSYLDIHNRYFHLRDDLKQRFDDYANYMFDGKRVLGTNIRESYIVLANGRDNHEESYNGEYISGHPKQPGIEELCDILEKKMHEWNCDYVFAECQTSYIENKLRERFGVFFLCSNHKRLIVDNLSLNSYKEASKKQKEGYSVVQNNIDYLKSIYLLSKCTSVYAGKCSGTVVAAFWNDNKYEHLEIFNNGVY